MSGETIYRNTWMNFTHKEKWFAYGGDTGISGPLVSDYYTQMLYRIRNGVYSTNFLDPDGPFNGLTVETWNSVLADVTSDSIDWDIEHQAGLTNYSGTKINHQYASKGTYSHEQGHLYGWKMDYGYDGIKRLLAPSRPVSVELVKIYRNIRGIDFTSRTPEPERYAEDFKYFFGADGVAGVLNSDDDANNAGTVGRQVRWAKDIVGLKEAIQFSWPVYTWLKDKSFSSFSYISDWRQYQWYNQSYSRWECYCYGRFYVWSNNVWVLM